MRLLAARLLGLLLPVEPAAPCCNSAPCLTLSEQMTGVMLVLEPEEPGGEDSAFQLAVYNMAPPQCTPQQLDRWVRMRAGRGTRGSDNA